MKYGTWTTEDLAARYPIYVKILHELTTKELEEFLKLKSERFPEDNVELKGNSSKTAIDIESAGFSNQQLPENIINALCHPDVVNKVADVLLSS